MGGLGFRTFTAGEVLTASNVQNYLQDQAVMVFAGSAARSSAIGTANFAEGMVSYLKDTDRVESYNGTNWVSVAPTSTQGLTLINTTSFSAVSSFSLATDTFTSTYDNYVLIVNIRANTADAAMTIRLRAAGVDASAANYNFAYNTFRSNNTAANGGAAGQTSLTLGELESTFNGRVSSRIEFYDPKIANATKVIYQSQDSDSGNNYASRAGGGVLNDSVSYDSASLLVSSGTITGTYYVYGFNK
jgi:hypothetical protein